MDFEDFFTSIFQLVDTWTETVEEEEYVRMLQKLILGTMYLRDNDVLEWRDNKVRTSRISSRTACARTHACYCASLTVPLS